MPNETYCNVIGIVDGKLRNNVLLVGNAISKPIGGAVEENAISMYKSYCETLGNQVQSKDKIEDMVEDGCLVTEDGRIRVTINWPVIINS